tara:strand:+ start:3248 stop:3829 length:582 start_codon:yes stop_codon:yes gene_type:complete
MIQDLLNNQNLVILGLILIVLCICYCNLFSSNQINSIIGDNFSDDANNVEGFKNFVTNTGLLPDGKYLIRGSRQQRYCTDSPNGLICNRQIQGPLEIFTLQHLEGIKYAIQGYRSGLWCTHTVTGLRCESPVVGDLQVFNLHPMGDGTHGIQSNRNKNWCIDSGNGMQCDVSSMNGWDYQKFEFIPIRYNNIR